MLLTMKDQQRVEVIQALMDSRLSAAQAAQVLGRSERQVWRLLALARDEGLAGLLHGTRGRAPANKSDDRLWQRVLKLAAEKYQGVNDRHLQELLAREHGLVVCKYAPEINKRMRPHLKMSGTSYRLNETYVKVGTEWKYLYPAVDSAGQTSASELNILL
jgi:transposase